jgi:hypothetical protein
MADIKQAAKWMQEGKRVRRANPNYPEGLANYGPESLIAGPAQGLQDVLLCSCHGYPKSIRMESLLADDWELAE